MTNKSVWRTVCQDAGDGSGDLVIELPEELLAKLNWKEGDTLNFDIQQDRTITLSKVQAALLRSQSIERVRLDITSLAEQIFESADAAVAWFDRPNLALGNQPPSKCCSTHDGCLQVLRVLHAIEYGGVT